MNILNSKDLIKVKQFIENNETIAYDIETDSLDFVNGNIIGFGISNDVEGYYITHLIFEDNQFNEVISKKDCIEILNLLKAKKLLAWNYSFDSRFTYNYFNVDLIDSLYIDGMLAKHTSNENALNYKLKDSAKEELGDDSTEEQKLMQESIKQNKGSKEQIYKASNDLIAKYCIQDCILTYKLSNIYLERLKKDNLETFFLEEEVIPVYKHVIIPMELKGIPVDVPALQSAQKEIEKEIKNLENTIHKIIEPDLDDFYNWFYNYHYSESKSGQFVQKLIEITKTNLPKTKSGAYSLAIKHIQDLPNTDFFKQWYLAEDIKLSKGIIRLVQKKIHEDTYPNTHPFNLSSKDHLKRLFFTKYKEKPISTTEKGNPQIDDRFIEAYKNKYDFLKLLQQYNKLNKINGTYISRLLQNNKNGIYYGSFFQHKTVSGRQSGDLQQLPRIMEPDEDAEVVVKYNNMIRTFFKTNENQTFVGADYESLEPHIFAHVSTDSKLQEIFNKGYDFYSKIAIDTENLNQYSADKKANNYLGKKNKQKRQEAKSYCLGVPYGMGGYKLSFQLNCSVDEAERLVQNYLNAYPNLKKWIKDTHKYVIENGYVKTISGRVRRYPRAKEIYNMYGDVILDDLELWKQYKDNKFQYENMKRLRREFKNYINNSTNVQIQGLAASIVSRAAVSINKEFKKQGIDAQICLLVHDEIVSLCDKKDAKKVAEIMQNIMENIWELSVKLKAEPKIAEIYADTK